MVAVGALFPEGRSTQGGQDRGKSISQEQRSVVKSSTGREDRCRCMGLNSLEQQLTGSPVGKVLGGRKWLSLFSNVLGM